MHLATGVILAPALRRGLRAHSARSSLATRRDVLAVALALRHHADGAGDGVAAGRGRRRRSADRGGPRQRRLARRAGQRGAGPPSCESLRGSAEGCQSLCRRGPAACESLRGGEHERRVDEPLAPPHDEPHGASGLRRGRGPGVPAQRLAVSVDALLDLFVQHGYGAVFTAILLDNAGLPIPGELLLLMSAPLLEVATSTSARASWSPRRQLEPDQNSGNAAVRRRERQKPRDPSWPVIPRTRAARDAIVSHLHIDARPILPTLVRPLNLDTRAHRLRGGRGGGGGRLPA